MLSKFRPRSVYDVIAVLGCFVALATGTAYAANTVFSGDIVDGQVKAPDIAQGAVLSDEIANGQVKAADIGDGEVRAAEIAGAAVTSDEIATGAVRGLEVLDDNLTGADVANNTLKGADVDESTLDIGDAARAYARVSPAGCVVDGACTTDQKKGVSSVIKLGTGSYCVIAPGIDAERTPAVVAVDHSTTSGPEGNASAMPVEGRGACGGSSSGFEVQTQRHPRVVVDANGVPNDALVAGDPRPDDNVGFTIVIP